MEGFPLLPGVVEVGEVLAIPLQQGAESAKLKPTRLQEGAWLEHLCKLPARSYCLALIVQCYPFPGVGLSTSQWLGNPS